MSLSKTSCSQINSNRPQIRLLIYSPKRQNQPYFHGLGSLNRSNQRKCNGPTQSPICKSIHKFPNADAIVSAFSTKFFKKPPYWTPLTSLRNRLSLRLFKMSQMTKFNRLSQTQSVIYQQHLSQATKAACSFSLTQSIITKKRSQ